MLLLRDCVLSDPVLFKRIAMYLCGEMSTVAGWKWIQLWRHIEKSAPQRGKEHPERG